MELFFPVKPSPVPKQDNIDSDPTEEEKTEERVRKVLLAALAATSDIKDKV